MIRLQVQRDRGWYGFAAFLMAAALVSVILAACGGGTTSTTGSGFGSASVTLSDPPSCTPPNGNFLHVFISIRSVQAHISSSAGDGSPGWQELALQLKTAPMQIDLLSKPNTQCLLAQLGSTSSLPVGTYQQIRLLLVSNTPGSNPVPATNNCGNMGFNCVVLSDNSVHIIDLSSQANTGLKIPPGQIQGGPITVTQGQNVDLNIDFNTCASLMMEGTGDFRLKPALTAEQVSTTTTGITGKVIDMATGQPVLNGTVLVALEQQNSPGVDTIFMQIATDANGNFNFCPLPANAKFDVVAVALTTAGVAYNATVITGVPVGTAIGTIPVVPELTGGTGPGTIKGFVSALNATNMGASADVTMSALQSINSGALMVTIPLETGSTQLIAVSAPATCPAMSPMNANCAPYTLVVPASNPMVGAFSATITFAPPAAGSVLYTVAAQAAVPLSGNTPTCTPPSMTTNQDTTSMPLAVMPGATTNAKEINFSGCM